MLCWDVKRRQQRIRDLELALERGLHQGNPSRKRIHLSRHPLVGGIILVLLRLDRAGDWIAELREPAIASLPGPSVVEPENYKHR